MRKNKYTNYIISPSLNGDTIVYLARYGKQKELIGRAATEKELVDLMAKEAQKIEDELLEKQAALIAAEEEKVTKKKKKGLGILWEPGSLVKDKPDTETAEAEVDEKTDTAQKASVTNTKTNLPAANQGT